MFTARAIRHIVLIVIVVFGMTVPATAIPNPSAPTETTGTASAHPADETNASVDVSVGQQLSTVITASSDEVRVALENTAFEISYQRGDEEERAEAIADRTEELRERATAIHEDYREATEAYESGEISKTQYAQRLATLNARATNLIESYDLIQQRAENVSALELRAAGVNRSDLEGANDNLSSVRGAGPAALLRLYTGESEGSIELDTEDGLSIEIESEDGEQSREIKRPRDDDHNFTVNQSAALEAAGDALSNPNPGRWVLIESKMASMEGYFEFEFRLRGDANRTGEAEVRVDGSTGTVFRLEEEIEPRDDDNDDERDEERDGDDERDDGGELAVLVDDGTPAPNATITLLVMEAGNPAANVTITLNGEVVGETDSDGTVEVTLPRTSEAELRAERGEAEGELEFEFEQAEDDVLDRLDVDTSLQNETVAVSVRFDGEAVRNATIYADDTRVGTTDTAGDITFPFDSTDDDELELEVVKGQFVAELEYVVRGGVLVLEEAEHEVDDDDRDERDDEREEDDRQSDGEQDDDEDDASDDDEEESASDEAFDGDLDLRVVIGSPAPNATITLEVRADDSPVEDVTIYLDDDVVGSTNATGRLAITLPDVEEIELTAVKGDAEAELEFDFEDDS